VFLFTEDSSGGYEFLSNLGRLTGKFEVKSTNGKDNLISLVLNQDGSFMHRVLSGETVVLLLDQGVSNQVSARLLPYKVALTELKRINSNLFSSSYSCFEQILLSSCQTAKKSLRKDLIPLVKLVSNSPGNISEDSTRLLKHAVRSMGVKEPKYFSPESACYAVYQEFTRKTCLRFVNSGKGLPNYWNRGCCTIKEDNKNYTCAEYGDLLGLDSKYSAVVLDSILNQPRLHSLTEVISFAELLSRQK
jgi:hypothetical protein